jgi:glycosyltransferase involved in cell wall biosynthesis
MLSILIPTYNFDCTFLVKSLSDEASQLPYDIEIIVVDDSSDIEFKLITRHLNDLPHVDLIFLEKNIGRSAIRNYMASLAKNDWLLFLDNDGYPVYPQFILKYLEVLTANPDAIICGGRTYNHSKPENPLFLLHWKYGTAREVKSPALRATHPYKGFQSNNFCIPKATFNLLKFDADFKQYGHEDTAFGLKASSLKIPVIHVDNPVMHLGLEYADVFLEKIAQACSNALNLYKHKNIILGKSIALISWLEIGNFDYIVYLVLRLFAPYLHKKLIGNTPTLWALDLFKLYVTLKLKFNEI